LTTQITTKLQDSENVTMDVIPKLYFGTALCRLFAETRSLHIHKNKKYYRAQHGLWTRGLRMAALKQIE